MKIIQVLMSTYNGEKYLREQIESILAQDCHMLAEVRLLVRDDGSTDATRSILEEYAGRYPGQVQWYQGENKGVINSFFDLIIHSDSEASYYALADQDDYWNQDKLSSGITALNSMEGEGHPKLYCCRPLLVDEELTPLVSEIKRPPMRPSFCNALVENIVTGCTVVMNPTLRDMVSEKPPQFTVMHDWWLYLVAGCFGDIYYDETPHICYRQHGGNAVGTNVSRWKELKDRVRRFRGNRRNISRQVSEFLRLYGDRKPSGDGNGDSRCSKPEAERYLALARRLVDSRKSLGRRIRLVKSGVIYRQRRGDDRIFRLILLSGSF